MAWQQVRTPNLDPVILQPTGNGGTYVLQDWFTWCLAYVQFSFGSGWAGASAWDCWENHTVDRHADWNLPGGVYVPIFFSGAGGFGHAAIYKDGQVWSSPVTHKPTADVWSSISKVESDYGVTYVGWAEGLGGTRVAQTASVSSTPAPAAADYSVVEVYPEGKKIRLKLQPTNLWGMNYHFDYMKDNPVEKHDKGEIWTVTNKVHHENGYDYYRREGEIDGFNVLDCEDYTPPPATPYVPPAAPVTAEPAKRYKVLSTVMWFDSSQDAQFEDNGKGTIAPGNYYLFDKGSATVQLGDDNMTPKYWINTKRNVEQIPVKVAPPAEAVDAWKATKVSFYEDRNRFDNYELQMDVLVKDLDHKGKDFFVSAYKPNSSDNAVLKVYGTVYQDGVKYYLLHHPEDAGWVYWYVIPQTNRHTGKPYLLKYSETYDTTPKAHELTMSELALEGFARLGYKIMDVVKRLRVNK